MSDLSPTMSAALDKAREHGTLERWPGGFWTYPKCEVVRQEKGWRGVMLDVPAWYTTAQTVAALLSRGRLVKADADAPNCRAVKPCP